jgi:hypothetical protein
MVNGIKIEDLTRTFQEVVHVTKALAIRYLWINDLCIVHDDLLGDSTKEIPRMADHYANADINIVAGVKDAQTKVLCPRTPPRFQPTRLNGTEDVFIGWLGTDAYNDPRGLRVSQYSDAWKYRSLLNLHPWTSQFTGHACRNLVLQGDEDSTPGAEAMCTMPTSQLYMRCREEIRWENGRRRPRTAESRSDWYDFVEEYSSQDFTFPADRLLAFFNLAHRYSRSSRHDWGEFLSGLWSKELLRGLLWWAEGDRASWSVPHEYVAPSWSWAAVPGRVKHVWPSDVKPLASIQEFDTSSNSSIISRYLVLRGLLVGIAPIKRAWSNWADDIKVRVLDGNENKEVLRI